MPLHESDLPRAPLAKAGPPPSVTHFGLSTVALLIVLGVLYALRQGSLPAWLQLDPVLLLCGAVAIPVVLLDLLVLRVHRSASTGLDWDKPFAPDLPRVATKLLGLVAALAPFALAYWAFNEYRGAFYGPFYELLRRFGPTLIAGSVLYFMFVDGRMREPHDAYWKLGRALLGNPNEEDGARRGEIANLYRGWLVKAYFFPLMFVWLNNSTRGVINFDLSTASWSNLRAYDYLYDFIFFIDLLFATVGYAVCFRAIDTHQRSAEPTMLGWAVALFCYEPFYSGLFEKQYVQYTGSSFGSWLAPYPTIRWVWAGAIVALIAIYVLATITFGVRFSNLTHRGILTNGPYRFTKHPAYVAKNISWWMASVPFIGHDGVANAFRRCVLLGCVNFMYFMRAKTEERHLSRDPTYVAYATWMNEHGVLRALGRIPIFRYVPPLANVPAAVAEVATAE